MTTTTRYLLDRYGPLMSPSNTAEILHYKNADCLRAAMSYWANRADAPKAIRAIRASRRKLGRRTYYVTEKVAEAVTCVLEQ